VLQNSGIAKIIGENLTGNPLAITWRRPSRLTA
jgi:hypothetical protein